MHFTFNINHLFSIVISNRMTFNTLFTAVKMVCIKFMSVISALHNFFILSHVIYSLFNLDKKALDTVYFRKHIFSVIVLSGHRDKYLKI